MSCLLIPLAVGPALLVYVLALAVIRSSARRRHALMSYRMLACLDRRLQDTNPAAAPAQQERTPAPAQQLCEAAIHE